MNFLDLKIKSLLTENNNKREEIRKIVRDIISIFKKNDEGDFYLPEDVTGEEFYDFDKIKAILTIELSIIVDDEVDGFSVNADWVSEDDVIELSISYNSENKNKLLYDLSGELNEIIAHEIRHIDQETTGSYNTKVGNKQSGEQTSKQYYTQPHELDAQIFGFKRISKLTKTPFDVVVKRWFNTHHNLHQMDDSDVKYVIGKIMSFKKEKGL
jgi:hypothetical protein